MGVRTFACVMLTLAVVSVAEARRAKDQTGLPTLHQIQTVTLAPSYSCQPTGARGYGETALFLSDYSRSINAPDLLFNGACGADDEFQASTAGDDMALVADLGPGVELGGVSAHLAFNLHNVVGYENETKFARNAPVRLGHTYVVLLNKDGIRGLFVAKVVAHERNKSVTIQYAVKQYQRLQVVTKANGFDWTAPSTREEKE